MIMYMITYPEVVESSACETLSCDIFWQWFDHAGLLHGQDRSRNELTMIPNCKVPRTNPHYVIKSKLNDQSALRVHLDCEENHSKTSF